METEAIQQKAIEYGVQDNFQDIRPDTMDVGQIAYTQAGKLIQILEWGTVTDTSADVRLLIWPSGNLADVSTYPTPDGKHCVELSIQIALGMEKGWVFLDKGGEATDVAPSPEAAQPEAAEASREADGMPPSPLAGPVGNGIPMLASSVGQSVPENPLAGLADDIFMGEDAPVPDEPYIEPEPEDAHISKAEMDAVMESFYPAPPSRPAQPAGGTSKVSLTLELTTGQLAELLALLKKWEGR